MSISTTQLLLAASFGAASPTRPTDHLFQTLSARASGDFDPTSLPLPASTLLDLTPIDESGRSTFALLTAAYDSRNATLNRLASIYQGILSI